jgi:hypothetical protein
MTKTLPSPQKTPSADGVTLELSRNVNREVHPTPIPHPRERAGCDKEDQAFPPLVPLLTRLYTPVTDLRGASSELLERAHPSLVPSSAVGSPHWRRSRPS